MDEQRLAESYEAPSVTDYGTLGELTGSAQLLFGGTRQHELGFSGAMGAGAAGGTMGVTSSSPGSTVPTALAKGIHHVPHAVVHATHGTHHVHAAHGTGEAAGHGAGSGSLPGVDRLPFTGFRADVAAAIGLGLTSAGALLRSLAGRIRPRA